MTDDLDLALAQIREACDRATPGPWFTESHGIMDATRSYTVVLFGDSSQDSADAAFIAQARQWVPNLVAETVRLRHERDLLAKALGDLLVALGVEPQALTGPQLLLLAADLADQNRRVRYPWFSREDAAT